MFHSLLILFNLFGWISPLTRRINLAALLATGFSWVGLGFFYGWGYCFCTDWHWQVRRALGHYDMPHSYTKFLVETLTGLDLPARLVDMGTLAGFLLALVLSAAVNIRDFTRRSA